jgi:hypothetical protein
MGPCAPNAVPCGCTPCAPAANVSSGLLVRFSPHLELSMQGEPTSVQGPCFREVIIEGQEQLPLQQEYRVGLRVPPSTMLAFRWSGLSGSVTRPS